MPFRFEGNGAADRLFEELGILRGAEWRPEVRVPFLAKAGIDFTRARDPNAIAALAEIMRERRDEADLLACLLESHIPRWAA